MISCLQFIDLFLRTHILEQEREEEEEEDLEKIQAARRTAQQEAIEVSLGTRKKEGAGTQK